MITRPTSRTTSKHGRSSPAGSALVISLVFIVLISIVLVGFVTTAALERTTVQSHQGKVQAGHYSAMAVDVVASRIAAATTSTNAAGSLDWWISQPGRVVSVPFAAVNAPTAKIVELTSGSAATVQENISVNLNPASFTQGTGQLVSDASTVLPVKWIYVRKDGGHEVAGTTVPTYDKSNPIVGRYAYWTDDESSRINLNAATSSTSPQSEVATHPSRLDLTALGPLTALDIQNVRAERANRVFNSVEEIRSVANAPNVAAAVATNKEALTHFNHSSDLNRFGEQRIVLTTQKSLAGGRPFLDILKDDKENQDPGIDAYLDNAKIVALFNKLYIPFNKKGSDWGLIYPPQSNFHTKTFGQKYGPKFVAGTILNLIDYVRSVESEQTLILPLRAAFNDSTGVLTVGVAGAGATGNYGSNAIRGNSRRLHLVEIGFFWPELPELVATVNKYRCKLKFRIYLPLNAGREVNIAGTSIQPLIKSTSGGNYYTSDTAIAATHVSESNTTMQPGEYRTVTLPIDIATTLAPTRPTSILFRLALKNAVGGTSYDFAPLEQSEILGRYGSYTLDPVTTTEGAITSVSTDDPAVNQSFADWIPRKTGSQLTSKFGSQDPTPESKLGTAVPVPQGGVPQQDGDANGNLTALSSTLPYPKGIAGNLSGLVGSVGDIGRVHSGIAGTSLSGKPWRTLRLQPRFAPNGTLPDWLLLDLFSVPLSASNSAHAAVLLPSECAVGGLVNLNTKLFPFSSTQLSREQPLKAVIQSAQPNATVAEVNEITGKISGYDGTSVTLASGAMTTGLAFGTTEMAAQGLYVMPGAICEVKGIADGGEASEGFVRSLVGFLTTQGNVFSIYTVSQSILQLENGTIRVLGESRTRSMLERDIKYVRDGGGNIIYPVKIQSAKVRTLSTTELGI